MRPGRSYGLPLLIKQKGLIHGIFTLNTLSGPNCFPKEPPLNTIAYLLHHGDYAKVQVLQGHSRYGHTSPGMYAFLTQLQRYPFPVCSFKRTVPCTPKPQPGEREICLKQNERDFLTQSQAWRHIHWYQVWYWAPSNASPCLESCGTPKMNRNFLVSAYQDKGPLRTGT